MVRKAIIVEIINIVWTLFEAAAAIAAGVTARSLALESFGFDSVIELIAGFVLLWRLSIEFRGKPSKKIKRAERTASWIVGSALMLLAVYILVSAVSNFLNHNAPAESPFGIIVAVASGILMPLIASIKKRLAITIKSDALKADAACSMVCAYMSWVLVIGVIATAVLHLWWIDSAISLVFVWFIAGEGWEALENASRKKHDGGGIFA